MSLVNGTSSGLPSGSAMAHAAATAVSVQSSTAPATAVSASSSSTEAISSVAARALSSSGDLTNMPHLVKIDCSKAVMVFEAAQKSGVKIEVIE